MRAPALLGNAALACVLVAAAACGGGGATAPGPAVPSATASGGATPTTPAASTSPSATASGTAPTTVTPPPAAALENKPLVPSALASDLKALGLDAAKLPPLSKMEPATLRKVMKTFTKALGTNCAGCHDPNNFRAATPKKKIASRMWDDYVRGLAFEDGSPLYCDSCHQGRTQMLDRRDKKALGKWMDAEYVAKLKRTDKQDNDCATCHGEEMEMHLLAKWSK
jgi:hypothetical protein